VHKKLFKPFNTHFLKELEILIKMFHIIEVIDHVRVEPKLFGKPTLEAVESQLKETYNDFYSPEIGKVIKVIDVLEVGEGIIIPGDGASYYKSKFKLLIWKPELQEIVYGIVSEITNFGAFIDLGSLKGMIHISQTMEDFVSFSKSDSLLGKATKRTLKAGDLCVARIIAISHKGEYPKIGLTMRQPGLGRIDWLIEDKKKKDINSKKVAKAEKEKKPGKK